MKINLNNTRFFADTLRNLTSDNQEDIEFENTVNRLLDSIFESIIKQANKTEEDLEEDEVNTGVEVSFKGGNLLVVDEVIGRLEALGFLVRLGFDTDEEVEYVNNLEREAFESDDMELIRVFNEAFIRHEDFIVSWD